jgi:hypothetical protein
MRPKEFQQGSGVSARIRTQIDEQHGEGPSHSSAALSLLGEANSKLLRVDYCSTERLSAGAVID